VDFAHWKYDENLVCWIILKGQNMFRLVNGVTLDKNCRFFKPKNNFSIQMNFWTKSFATCFQKYLNLFQDIAFNFVNYGSLNVKIHCIFNVSSWKIITISNQNQFLLHFLVFFSIRSWFLKYIMYIIPHLYVVKKS